MVAALRAGRHEFRDVAVLVVRERQRLPRRIGDRGQPRAAVVHIADDVPTLVPDGARPTVLAPFDYARYETVLAVPAGCALQLPGLQVMPQAVNPEDAVPLVDAVARLEQAPLAVADSDGDNVARLVQRLALCRPGCVCEAAVASEAVVQVGGRMAVAVRSRTRRAVEAVGVPLDDCLCLADRGTLLDHEVALVVPILGHVAEWLDVTDEPPGFVADEQLADDRVATDEPPLDEVAERVVGVLLADRRRALLCLSVLGVDLEPLERLRRLDLVVVRVVAVLDVVLERSPADHALDAPHRVVREPDGVPLTVEDSVQFPAAS